MKLNLLLLFLLGFVATIYSNTIIVDINGSGDYTSIQPAFNAASVGDTVKILPGTYDGAISLTKNIIVLGSGYENTKITSSNNPTLTISSGKIMWVQISNTGGNGIFITGGLVENVVIRGCSLSGIYTDAEGSSTISNCVIVDNGQYGIFITDFDATLNVTNCISYNNGNYDFRREFSGTLSVSYSNGSISGTTAGPGCIDQDPKFVSATDLHLQQTSPCWDTGNTSMEDPDGTRSDMGYFGGEECPIYPVVTRIIIIPMGVGEIVIDAIGHANY